MKHIIYLHMLCVLLLVPCTLIRSQKLLNPLEQVQFTNPLPIPSVLDGRKGAAFFTISISQFKQSLGLIDPQTKESLLTTVWGYNNSYPGPTILAKKGKPIKVFWQNNLVNNEKLPLPHLLPIDPSVHWALKDISDWQRYGVPIVTHLHGGLTESASDGLPDAWYTPNFLKTGDLFKKGDREPYLYHNKQDAATIWYHDHTLGITRLNVYAGLAGFYLITDDLESTLIEQGKLPAAPYDIGLAIQDRMFDYNGQLYYPSKPEESDAHTHSVLPEFFGDFILVNGKIWPVLEVEPRPYRFRLLNGSDSRFYNLYLSSGQNIVQIGSDHGLLPSSFPVSKMLLGTGERKDVIIDFSTHHGQTIILQNDANTPYPEGDPVDEATTGRIMAFKVTKPLDFNYPITSLPADLRPVIPRLSTKLPARKLILFENIDEFGRLKPMLGTVEHGALEWHDPVTENPKINSTEVWEIYNETEDAHTIHLHMVSMQLIDRQKFEADVDPANGKPSNIKFLGEPQLPAADEAGWKDTYVTMPGEVTRVIANFGLRGNSVWHCHILSHEDHEMMRPYYIGNLKEKEKANNADIVEKAENLKLRLQMLVSPNPFNDYTNLQFKLTEGARVRINIYDAFGNLIKNVYQGNRSAGIQQFVIDGSRWNNGTYYCELSVNNQKTVHKLLVQK
jgi:spore coat protein A, manganese oxidase